MKTIAITVISNRIIVMISVWSFQWEQSWTKMYKINRFNIYQWHSVLLDYPHFSVLGIWSTTYSTVPTSKGVVGSSFEARHNVREISICWYCYHMFPRLSFILSDVNFICMKDVAIISGISIGRDVSRSWPRYICSQNANLIHNDSLGSSRCCKGKG